MKKSAVILACLIAAHVPLSGFYGAALAAESQTSEDSAAAVSSEAGVDASAHVGDSIYSVDGRRLGAVYAASKSGAAQLIMGTKMVAIPASTLSVEEGKLTTSLSRKDVMKLR